MSAANGCVRVVVVLTVGLLTFLSGCGVLSVTRTEYANALVTADGGRVNREDVDAIVEDADLTREEKIEALGDLGIEDQDLIDALLTLPDAT